MKTKTSLLALLLLVLFSACQPKFNQYKEADEVSKDICKRLIKLEENTYIADSPGFSSFEIIPDNLEGYFVEFLEYIKDCRYRGCNHVLEEECGIKYAVRDGKIEKSRYESYCMLKNSKK